MAKTKLKLIQNVFPKTKSNTGTISFISNMSKYIILQISTFIRCPHDFHMYMQNTMCENKVIIIVHNFFCTYLFQFTFNLASDIHRIIFVTSRILVIRNLWNTYYNLTKSQWLTLFHTCVLSLIDAIYKKVIIKVLSLSI